MFYLLDIEDYVRVEPKLFGLKTKDAIKQQINESYVNSVTKETGFIISVIDVADIDDGVIIPEDGAVYYNAKFKVLSWMPELHELVFGTITEIANFGAFIQIGPMKGMIHISQTMEDYVSLSKTGTLSGKTTKRSLSVGDDCIARIVAISFKGDHPKIGVTMRQSGLGKVEWMQEEKQKKQKAVKSEKKEKKKAKEK